MALESVLRETLSAVEAQRDDAIAYLGAIRSVLGALRRMPGLRACAREVAAILTHELRAESCAILARVEGSSRSSVLGFATQAETLGGPAEPYGVETWIGLADCSLVSEPFTWLKPSASGGWEQLGPGEFAGESFQVIPFPIADERRGTIVLHRLAAPAQSFASENAIPLIASAIGEALTVAQSRDATGEVTEKLESELGVTRSSLHSREQSLAERERTISRLTDAVLQSNRAKREFLSIISHELRTPLNAIVGFASLLSEDFQDAANEDQREMMHSILDRACHLTSLIEDVLLYVDLEAGRGRALYTELDLRAVVDEAVEVVERAYERRFELRIAIDHDASHPRIDAQLVRRMLFHLLSNAYKFTARGTVTVRAERGPAPGSVVVSVQDTGEGMPQTRIDEMFDVFTQVDGSSRRRHEGLGLGLALVHRAVDVLGGELSVQSTPGVGTTVRVSLPNALELHTGAAAG
ncbi:HAMP domain-containing histidine kinase [Candidatus Binatia bacterium]|jgi:signal transduction histidine kinase|nr:HAMP domain-containing histidine kinase [Candidatus Binatia bacterium]